MKKNVLLICANELIEEKAKAIFEKNENWDLYASINDEESISIFQIYNIQLVIMDADLNEVTQKKLTSIFAFQNKDIVILRLFYTNITEKIKPNNIVFNKLNKKEMNDLLNDLNNANRLN